MTEMAAMAVEAVGSGAVTWLQALVVGMVLVLAAGSGYVVAWRLQVLRSRDRAVITQAFEVELARLQAKIEATDASIEARVTAIEHFNAGTIVVLDHMKKFHEEIKDQFVMLQQKRSEDMQRLHTRLDSMWNVVSVISPKLSEAVSRAQDAVLKGPNG